jgi:hypothetical protein
MPSTTCRIDSAFAGTLRLISQLTGEPVSQLMNEAAFKFLEREGAMKIAQIYHGIQAGAELTDAKHKIVKLVELDPEPGSLGYHVHEALDTLALADHLHEKNRPKLELVGK